MTTRGRAFHTLTFVVATAALVLQFVLVWQGHAVLDEVDPPARDTRLVRFFSYFTILSNLLVAGTALWLAACAPYGRLFRVLRLNAVTGIAVTAVVHWFLLRPLLDLDGVDYLADKALHVVVPVLAVAGWVAFGPRGLIARDDLLFSAVYPGLYLAWTLVSGGVGDWYPYPFIDVGLHGYAVVLVNAAGVVALLTAVSLGAWWLDRRMARHVADSPA